ncbi:MAG TPA: aminotransferase class V-fold PLP-dependent enzyme [Candidatus Binatia bacterium]|jgi:glutamate/tyrosine decarboxylase-like PLP-dependent enzyme|nr:aminotransferase class V-fold PLP-dependent enzyme [Candidatus Binatia bacterium]
MAENALNTDAFPSLAAMQRDVLGWVSSLLGGGDEAAGFLTSGGTESLLMAVLAARERGRAERGVAAPEMVLPASAHAAFEKAAHYFGVRSVRVPVGDDYRVDAAAMAAAVTERTVLVVGSAPQYPQGVIDPIADIAALAAARGIACHVDACMGGMVLPFLEREGQPLPPWDFRIAGVTSISVDLHKFGYTAKGASVIMHRTRALRRFQTFTTDNWLGGRYGSSGVLGTKSGGAIAAAWAVMRHLGEDGYRRLTRAARDTTIRLDAALRATPGCVLRGTPETTLLAFGFDDPAVEAYAVADALWRRGWYVDRQGPPPSLHCTVNAVHATVLDEFLAAFRESIAEVRVAGTAGRKGAYGTIE